MSDTEQSDKKKRSGKINRTQKEALLDFLEEYPALATGQISSSFTFKDQTIGWDHLTKILNRLGANRDAGKWKKCWQDLRSDTKNIAATLAASTKATGGGEGIPYHLLSPFKQRILALCGGQTVVEGHESVSEFGIGSSHSVKRNLESEFSEDEDQPSPKRASTQNTSNLKMAERKIAIQAQPKQASKQINPAKFVGSLQQSTLGMKSAVPSLEILPPPKQASSLNTSAKFAASLQQNAPKMKIAPGNSKMLPLPTQAVMPSTSVEILPSLQRNTQVSKIEVAHVEVSLPSTQAATPKTSAKFLTSLQKSTLAIKPKVLGVEVSPPPKQLHLATTPKPSANLKRPSKSDTVIQMHQNEITVWEKIAANISTMTSLMERSVLAQEETSTTLTSFMERSVLAQEKTANALVDLVNFVLKKK